MSLFPAYSEHTVIKTESQGKLLYFYVADIGNQNLKEYDSVYVRFFNLQTTSGWPIVVIPAHLHQ